MFFIINTGQATSVVPTCHGPYLSKDAALDAFKLFTQPGRYAVYGPADATGDEATIEPVKVTIGKATGK